MTSMSFDRVFETKAFLRACRKLLNTAERTALKNHLLEQPRTGDVIPGTGGIRKLRWARPGMGKRGGLRVIYYLLDERGVVVLLTAYAKSEQEDLSRKELKEWADAVQRIRDEIAVEGDEDDD